MQPGATAAPSNPLPPGMRPARFGRRAVAFLIDGVLCGLVAALFTGPHHPPGNWSLLVFVLVYPLFTGFIRRSPGMLALGLRLEGIADGRPIGYFRALLRTLLICVVIPAVLPGPDGRPWHDKIVGSILHHKPRA